jgi:glycine hydroxymethyltransferase
MVTSGLRIGTPALATRGFGDAEFTEVADVIALALKQDADIPALRARVRKLTDAFPLYPGLGPSGFPVEQVELASSIEG